MMAKYFWDLKGQALKETRGILADPGHPQFAQRMVTLLSRCDKPGELFSVIPKKRFLKAWPGIRAYWLKRDRRSDARDWWETLTEQFSRPPESRRSRAKGTAPAFFRKLGGRVREARIERNLSQRQLALIVGMKQPDISRIEEGRKNVTLFTLMRLCKALGIEGIDLG